MNIIMGYWPRRVPVIVNGEIFCWPILKPVFFTTNMAIKLTKKHQAPIFLII